MAAEVGQAKRNLEPRQNAQLCGINSVGELCDGRAVLNLGYGATGLRDIRRKSTCKTKRWRRLVLASSFGSGVLNPRRGVLFAAALLCCALLHAVGSRQTEWIEAHGRGWERMYLPIRIYFASRLCSTCKPGTHSKLPCDQRGKRVGSRRASHALMHAFPGEHESRPMDVEAAVAEPIGASSTCSHNEHPLKHQIGGCLNQGVQALVSCHGTNRGGFSK